MQMSGSEWVTIVIGKYLLEKHHVLRLNQICIAGGAIYDVTRLSGETQLLIEDKNRTREQHRSPFIYY